MSVQLRIVHTTRYQYADSVPICYNRAHITPRTYSRQRLLERSFKVTPVTPVMGEARVDYFGNDITYFTIQEPHTELDITAFSVVEVSEVQLPDPATSAPWRPLTDVLKETNDPEAVQAYQFVFDSRFVKISGELRDYAATSFPAGRPVVEGLLDLTRRVYKDFAYDPTATTVSTPLETVMKERRGVCQDFAHLQIGCLRSLGIPARYVSGYIHSHPVEGAQALTGAHASHAWLSCYCPGHGWIDVDPTNNLTATLDHITLAWGRDYDDVSPVRGVILGGGEHALFVAVEVTRINPT